MTAAMQSRESVDGSKGNVLQEVHTDLQETEGSVLPANLQETELQVDRPKSIVQQIDSAVSDSRRGLYILEFVSKVLIDGDDGKDDSLCIGQLLEDYVGNVLKRLDRVDELVCDLGRQINE
jgi:hypothetical protein